MPFRDRYTGLINRYRDHLPVNDDTPLISLGEGNTPLIRLKNIPRLLGKDVDIYVKYEGLNPTAVSYTHLRAHETPEHLVCRLLLEKKK